MKELTPPEDNREDGISSNLKNGYRAAITLFALTLVYIALAAGTLISRPGLPPEDWYLTSISLVSILAAVVMVFVWAAVYICVPANRKVNSLFSLMMITALALLTSITRFVQLSLIPRAQAAGKIDGLEWFQVYGEFSIMADIELLAWGGFLGLAFLSLAPVFRGQKLERVLFWTLLLSGLASLIGALGKAVNNMPSVYAGFLGWGLGLAIVAGLLAFWFKAKLKQ